MSASNDVFCRLAEGIACGTTQDGFFAGADTAFYRWRVDAPADDRVLWSAMLRRGVYLADLRRWAGRHVRGLSSIIEHGLSEGWLRGQEVLEPDPANLRSDVDVILLGPPDLIPSETRHVDIPPRGRGERTTAPQGPVASGTWVNAYVRHRAISAVVYDGTFVEWDGLAAVFDLVGLVPLVAYCDLGHEQLVATFPKGPGACLECMFRWYAGSSPWSRELNTWIRHTIAQPIPWRRPHRSVIAAVHRRLAEVLDGSLALAALDMIDPRRPEDPESSSLFRHPSCSQPTSRHASTFPARSARTETPARLDPEAVSPLIGRSSMIHSFAIEDIGSPSGGPPYYLAKAAPNAATRFLTTDPLYCFGDGDDPEVARTRCIAESLERYCIIHYDDSRLIRGSRPSLPHALDPRELPLFAKEQYEERDFVYVSYEEDEEYDWVEGTALGSGGGSILVPAEAVFLGYQPLGKPLMPASSTGVAVDSSPERAVKQAILEVVERDALALMFLLRLSLPRLRIEDDEVVPPMAERMKADGFVLNAFSLRLDLNVEGALVTAVRTGGQPPRLLKGAAASLNGRTALRHAFREAWRGFLYYRKHPGSVPTSLHSVAPSSVEYNIAYYQDDENISKLAFLLDSDSPFVPVSDSPDGPLSVLVDQLRSSGYDPVHVDCTLPEVRMVGLHCARVIVPGLQPISFGIQPWRLAESRIAQVAGRVSPGSLRSGSVVQGLNTAPHFFA